MPLIRKKTSKRGTTHERRKISQKVRESRKKKKKEAKNNVEWKSKHPKDPGIPSAFPYKDQILAEVQEQKRLTAEEKERRKQAKKELKDAAVEQEKQLTIQDVGLDGIASISARRLNAKTISKSRHVDSVAVSGSEGDEETIPMVVNPSLLNLNAVLDEADVMLEVLDVRDPLPHRCPDLEAKFLQKGKAKKIMLVLTKIDLSPRNAVAAWYNSLRADYPTFIFRSASAFIPSPSNGTTPEKRDYDDALGLDDISQCLSTWSKEKGSHLPLVVAIVGSTNAGKSSFVNSLLHSPSASIYAPSRGSFVPSTRPREVIYPLSSETNLRVIDTSGWVLKPSKTEDNSALESMQSRDILLRNRGRIDRLKDPSPPISHILSRANAEDLMLLYNLPAFQTGNMSAFLAGVARSMQLVKKKGILDTKAACRTILRDWSTGKFAWYTQPPSTPSPQHAHTDPSLGFPSSVDIPLVHGLATKAEMRKGGKEPVCLLPSEIELRSVDLDAPWDGGSLDDADDVEDGESFHGISFDEMGEEESAAEDEDEDDAGSEDSRLNQDRDQDRDQDEAQPADSAPASRKQKRKRNANSEDAHERPRQRAAASVADSARRARLMHRSSAKRTAANKVGGSATQTRKHDDEKGYDFSEYF